MELAVFRVELNQFLLVMDSITKDPLGWKGPELLVKIVQQVIWRAKQSLSSGRSPTVKRKTVNLENPWNFSALEAALSGYLARKNGSHTSRLNENQFGAQAQSPIVQDLELSTGEVARFRAVSTIHQSNIETRGWPWPRLI